MTAVTMPDDRLARQSGNQIVVFACTVVLGFSVSLAAERTIYPDPGQAQVDVAECGGDWCTDCLVLDRFFHGSANKPLLEAYDVLVHVNVGRLDINRDLVERFQIRLGKGVPALVVLDAKTSSYTASVRVNSKRCGRCGRVQ